MFRPFCKFGQFANCKNHLQIICRMYFISSLYPKNIKISKKVVKWSAKNTEKLNVFRRVIQIVSCHQYYLTNAKMI